MSSLFRIFRSIFVGYIRYIVILSCTVCTVVALFTMVRQVTSSISMQVSLESRPIYGTDIQVRIPSLAPTDTLQYIRSILPTDGVDITLRQQFNTTLINQSGTTSLVRIVAYSGTYPQRGILDTTPIYHTGYVLPGVYTYMQNLAITKNTYDMYASGGYIDIGGQRIRATHIISASSDNSISFGGDNHLIVLPRDSISGSLLLSSGARLDTTIYIQVAQDRDIPTLLRTLQTDTRIGTYDISTYTQSQQATTGIVADLVDYILLVLVVASVYSIIVIHSMHSRLLSRMSSMLGILYRIWLTRRRQVYIFTTLYILLLLPAVVCGIGISYLLVLGISLLPGADGIVSRTPDIYWSLYVLSPIILGTLVYGWMPTYTYVSPCIYTTIYHRVRTYISLFFGYILRISPILLGLGTALCIILGISWRAMAVGIWLLCTGYILAMVIYLVYRLFFRYIDRYRYIQFPIYDAVRSLVRPGTPSISITLSLSLVGILLVFFLLFSLSFRDRVSSGAGDISVFAINILPADVPAIRTYDPSISLYSVMRARIVRIGTRTLTQHFGGTPSGEYTREFNITRDDRSAETVSGQPYVGTGQVSVDRDFAKRLGVRIGDSITFSLAGREIEKKIVAIRVSDRESFRPFFYFAFDPVSTAAAPYTFFATTSTRTPDTWKKDILYATGPHVTFVDVAQIVSIVQSIWQKILSVIWLFLSILVLGGCAASISLLGGMRASEQVRERLYTLYGMPIQDIYSISAWSRYVLLGTSYMYAAVCGVGIYAYATYVSSVLSWSYMGMCISLGILAGIWLVLGYVVGRRR